MLAFAGGGCFGATGNREDRPVSEVAKIGIGGIEVIALKDGQMQAQPPLFPDYDAEKAARAAAQAGIAYDGKTVDIPINAFVVRSGEAVVLVDAGSPPGFGEGTGAFGQALAQAGVAPGEVTHLAMTHLHIDHVGGLTDGAGRAVFDNAELISGEGDWRHFHSDEVYAAANSRARQSIDVSRRAVAPYANRRREVSGETGVAPGVSMVPLPGHTPGHCGVLIEDGDAQLLIWGDIMHVPDIQAPMPTRHMTGAPDRLYNLYATYELPSHDLQLGLFYTFEGDALQAGATVADNNFVPNVYSKGYGTLNFSASKKLGKHLRLKFQAKNLTNPEIQEVYRSDYIAGDAIKTSYTKGLDLSLSLTASF